MRLFREKKKVGKTTSLHKVLIVFELRLANSEGGWSGAALVGSFQFEAGDT